MPPIKTGLEILASDPPAKLRKARLGLLCNPASLLTDFTPAADAVAAALPGCLRCLFSPQHGFFADKQDNMVESGHGRHPELGIKIYSLYGETRKPQPDWFDGLDALLVDLVDVGCRVYTFFTTVTYCLKQAARQGVEVWILDRPNPLGRGAEGPILPQDLHSFVGAHGHAAPPRAQPGRALPGVRRGKLPGA